MKALSQSEIDRIAESGRVKLEQQRGDQERANPDPINLDAALSLGQLIPLLWRDTEYFVAPISVEQAIRLQRVNLRWTKPTPGVPTEEQIDGIEKLYAETIDLFWSLLSPRPATNPFSALLPKEVGSLIGFFFTCQTIQNEQQRQQAVSR